MATRIAILAVLLVVLAGVLMNSDRIQEQIARFTSRGIRNNNPGNIRITSIPWRNKVPAEQNTDGEYEQFLTAFDGIRALARDLTTKSKRGLTSIRKIIEVYAPRSENDTAAYIKSVARRTGLDPDQEIDVAGHLVALTTAIIIHENGSQPYSESLIVSAVTAA